MCSVNFANSQEAYMDIAREKTVDYLKDAEINVESLHAATDDRVA